MRCQEIMRRSVATVGASEPVTVAARKMRDHEISFLPVVDAEGIAIGVVTARDIVIRVTANELPSTTSLENVMTSEVLGCGEDDRPADWEYLHPALIVPNCLTSACHTKNNAQSDIELWDHDVACATLQGYADPDNPSSSSLLQLFRGEAPGLLRMPPDRKLPDPDIELFEQWIAEGAECE